ncbi:hypothetical protein BKA81DRAFT_187851 [Phyllosticta paracitricarpa]
MFRHWLRCGAVMKIMLLSFLCSCRWSRQPIGCVGSCIIGPLAGCVPGTNMRLIASPFSAALSLVSCLVTPAVAQNPVIRASIQTIAHCCVLLAPGLLAHGAYLLST